MRSAHISIIYVLIAALLAAPLASAGKTCGSDEVASVSGADLHAGHDMAAHVDHDTGARDHGSDEDCSCCESCSLDCAIGAPVAVVGVADPVIRDGARGRYLWDAPVACPKPPPPTPFKPPTLRS